MSGSDVRVLFGGLASDGSARGRLERASAAARRWSFVDVRGGSSAEAWWGEALPFGGVSRWRSSGEAASGERVHGCAGELAAEGGGDRADLPPGRSAGAGRHPVARISPSSGTIELWAGDGTSPLFYAAERDAFCFASDPTLLRSAQAGVPELDPVGLASLFALGHTPPGRSLFAGLRRLPPRSLLRGGPAGCEKPVPRWGQPASRGTDALPAREGGREVDAAVEALAGAVARVDAAGTWLPLTGGRDSRALLACLRPGGPVRAYTRGRRTDAEFLLARRAARLHRIAHRRFPFPAGYIARSFPRIIHLTGGCVSAIHGHAVHPLVSLAADGARRVLPGLNGEYGRAFRPAGAFAGVRDGPAFWERFFMVASELPGESSWTVLREPWREAVRAALPRAHTEYASLLLSPSGTAWTWWTSSTASTSFVASRCSGRGGSTSGPRR